MFKLKKVMAVFFAIAMLITTTISAMAAIKDSYTFGLATGYTEAGDGYTYVTFTCDGFTGEDAYTPAGTITYKVTKGVFNSVMEETFGTSKVNTGWNAAGLHSAKENNGVANAAPDFKITLNKEFSDEFDLLTITWFGEYKAYKTTTGDIVGLILEYNGTPQEAIFTPYLEDSNGFFAAASDVSKNILADAVTLSDTTYNTSYKLAANSNVITAVEEEEPPVDDNTVAFEGFTGTKENGEADGSVAVATSKTFTTKADAPSQINWTVNLKAGGKGTYTSTVDATGGAEFTLGMVINGLAKELVASIEAVLVQ